jgi:hypothetical protein
MIKVQLKLDGEIPKRNCPFCPCQYTHATVIFSRVCCDDDEDDDDGNDDLISFQFFFIYSRDAVTAYWSIKREQKRREKMGMKIKVPARRTEKKENKFVINFETTYHRCVPS